MALSGLYFLFYSFFCFNFFFDLPYNLFCLCQNFIITESHYFESYLIQDGGSLLVCFSVFFIFVASTVNFDDQPLPEADEICNVVVYRVLSSESYSQLVSSEISP